MNLDLKIWLIRVLADAYERSRIRLKQQWKKASAKYNKIHRLEVYQRNKRWKQRLKKTNPEAYKDLTTRWSKKNAEKVKQYQKDYRIRMREKNISLYIQNRENRIAKSTAWYYKNKRRANSRKNIRNQERSKTDPAFKLTRNLRISIWSWLKRGSKSGRLRALLGCSYEDFKNHLESLWKPGMSWANYGITGWHVDHKRPITSFDLTSEEQQKKCWHFSNLQPLRALENIKKSNKLTLEAL